MIGKTYLGTGDHLFQPVTDPNDEHYGYYYYNSQEHAASYNQSDQRFYVYDYLERTNDSAGTDDGGSYSDFLPLNSPYADTNGKNLSTYSYSGVNGELNGVTHYQYETGYSDSNNSANHVGTNFWYGMRTEIEFYLPNTPGTQNGEVNKDLYGNDMHFQFSGDDDVWVLIDDELVLDLGGIHGIESGEINFSTGIVTVNGTETGRLTHLKPGDYTLTIYYLERGSSMANCAFYFNLAPRFSFSIQKEDVLTRDVLNGAKFSVYTDPECTVPAKLWPSKESHDRKDDPINEFTVVDGAATMWGMGASNTYYIKETGPPDKFNKETYSSYVNGIICVTIDKMGMASYSVELLKENGLLSTGFTVHGFRIDDETQTAYIIATNAPVWATETTQVTAFKQWNDALDHSDESVSVYLTVKNQNGTVVRLQEATLSSENGWMHTWENLPKYWEPDAQGKKVPIEYRVEESYVSGYYSKVTAESTVDVVTTEWTTATGLTDKAAYILANSGGQYLSTLTGSYDEGFQWVSESTAKSSPLAQWTVSTSGSYVKLTNGAGQTISFYDSGSYASDFFAYGGTTAENSAAQQLFIPEFSNNTFRLYHQRSNGTRFYLTANMTTNGQQKFTYSNNQWEGMSLTAIAKTKKTEKVTLPGTGFLITNTPLEKETSLTVSKIWDYGNAQPNSVHDKEQVTVELLANGSRTGRTVTLSLKNGWSDTFRGLPYTDDTGARILYSVEEHWDSEHWVPYYGAIVTSDGDPPTYSTTITNVYLLGSGPELPSTGSYGREMYQLCGGGIMLLSLAYGIWLWSKRERRRE